MNLFTRGTPWRRWVLFAAVALLLVGCSQSTASKAGAAKGDSTSQAGHHAALNEKVQIGAVWSMQLTAAKASQGTDTDKPSGGNVYLLCDVHVTNTTSQSQDLYTVTTFTLLDAQGQLYTSLPLSFVTTPDSTLAGGASASGEIAFLVPAATTKFTLVFSSGAGQGYWDIPQISS
ncbi:MAG: DUF4352 domain-containing protein [Ktedonobacterales bacterium]|nr:DUF4352 domain-containing protein [Ktedonobacterales bacterium]